MMKIKCIENKQTRNKNRDACRGGVNSIMGGAENKKRKKGERGARGPGDFGWAGSVIARSASGQKRYKRVGRPFFPHFFFSFSLFSSFESKRSLLSPKAAPVASSSPARRTAVEGSPTRWPASYRGGATASELKPPLFFKIFFFSYVF